MRSNNNFWRSNYIVGALYSLTLVMNSCTNHVDNTVNVNDNLTFLLPKDSMFFDYSNETRKNTDLDYFESRYGYYVSIDENNNFVYLSIDSDNQLHKFESKTNTHSYTKKIWSDKIDAYKIDNEQVYLLYNDVFHIKNYQLQTLDSFPYKSPSINQRHSIDFSGENNSNLFKVGDYYALMYYVVDDMPDGSSLYRNHEKLFYFFNRDTAFFGGNDCIEFKNSFQYFRFPAITSDNQSIFHAPRVLNCISKTNHTSTKINSKIDYEENNYLSFEHSDQYEISKLKNYRLGSHYNRDLLVSGDNIYLIREIPQKIYFEEGVKKYKHIIEIRKYDKELNHIESYYIENNVYSLISIKNGRVFLFDFEKNKTLIYEL